MQALKSGVNVLDTAPNFMDGQSERLMGSALKDMSAAGELRREVRACSACGWWPVGKSFLLQAVGSCYARSLRVLAVEEECWR